MAIASVLKTDARKGFEVRILGSPQDRPPRRNPTKTNSHVSTPPGCTQLDTRTPPALSCRTPWCNLKGAKLTSHKSPSSS